MRIRRCPRSWIWQAERRDQHSVSSWRKPGPICGRPPWHKSFVRFDRIACAHMSGLSMQLVRPLAKMVFAMRVPINPATSLGQWVLRTCSHLGTIDRTISSALAAPVRPVGEPAGRPNLSITPRRLLGRRFADQAARHRTFPLSSSASRRYEPSCWPALLPQVSTSCASGARSARAAHDLSLALA